MPVADLQLDYSLTDDFCRNHFLVGLLLREVGGALQEFREIRQIAIQVLKSLMIKHTFDDRYAAKVSPPAVNRPVKPHFHKAYVTCRKKKSHLAHSGSFCGSYICATSPVGIF